MFSLLKRKNLYAQPAKQVYGETLTHVRNPMFYEDFGVPDTFDGRFELLLLHLFMVIHVTLDKLSESESAEFNQALFDVTFSDMDQTLREMGIGDMGIPKHMRRMMKAFNGRMHAYEKSMEQGSWGEALGKNLFGTIDEVDERAIKRVEQYITKTLGSLSSEKIIQGTVKYSGDVDD